jgi:hypothetical protein
MRMCRSAIPSGGGDPVVTISEADMDVADDVADAAVRDGEGVAAVVAMLVGVGDSAGLLTLTAAGDATALVLTKKRNTNRSANRSI